jgi:hypothetical protein
MQDFSAPPMPEQADSNGIQDLSRGTLSFRDSQLRDLDQLSAVMGPADRPLMDLSEGTPHREVAADLTKLKEDLP